MTKVKGSHNSRFVGSGMKINAAQDMRRYDKLPRQVRDAFKHFDGDHACIGVSGALKKVGSVDRVIRHLVGFDRQISDALWRADFGTVPPRTRPE